MNEIKKLVKEREMEARKRKGRAKLVNKQLILFVSFRFVECKMNHSCSASIKFLTDNL